MLVVKQEKLWFTYQFLLTDHMTINVLSFIFKVIFYVPIHFSWFFQLFSLKFFLCCYLLVHEFLLIGRHLVTVNFLVYLHDDISSVSIALGNLIINNLKINSKNIRNCEIFYYFWEFQKRFLSKKYLITCS